MDGPASILLVDDDIELLKALAKVLEREGYEVVSYPDAMSAMRDINTNHNRFDLIVTDIFMPGMSGTAFLTAIKTVLPTVPVILMTAFGDWGQYMEAMRKGATDYLTKPIHKADLLASVQRALEPRGHAAG